MKPILFSAEMVRAIQDLRKTQTRRIVKPQPSSGIRKSVFVKSGLEDGHGREIKPRYQPGDILWVRETWLKADDGYCYKVDIEVPSESEDLRKAYGYKWRPSIFMPREAARIFLRVKYVRVERLQEITTEDICKEGVWIEPPPIVKNGVQIPPDFEKRTEAQKDEYFKDAARATYIGQCKHISALHREWEKLWDNLNAKRGYGWDVNPWVWVYEFEKINKEEAERLEGME
mgnify:CR=1 FL=1